MKFFCKDIGLSELSDAVREYRPDGGRLKIDIFAKNQSGESVVIENQIKKTDHNHLGQIIEYAAAVNAKTVVWNAFEISKERADAIHWLNENCSGTTFYLVKVEICKGGEENSVAFDLIEPRNAMYKRKRRESLLLYVRYNFFWNFVQWASQKEQSLQLPNFSAQNLTINDTATSCVIEINADYHIKFTANLSLANNGATIGVELCAKNKKALEKIVSNPKAKKYRAEGRRLCTTQDFSNVCTLSAQKKCFEWYMKQALMLIELY